MTIQKAVLNMFRYKKGKTLTGYKEISDLKSGYTNSSKHSEQKEGGSVNKSNSFLS